MAKPKKLSVIERLKRTKTPGAKLYKDATAEERAALLAPIEQVIQQTSERLNAIDLQNDGNIDSVGRAGRVAGLSADHIDAMTLGEFVEEVEILHERDNRMARKVANEIQKQVAPTKTNEWTDWRAPKVAMKWFPTIKKPRSWSAFARQLRKEKLLKDHPDSGFNLCSIHQSVFGRRNLNLPANVASITHSGST